MGEQCANTWGAPTTPRNQLPIVHGPPFKELVAFGPAPSERSKDAAYEVATGDDSDDHVTRQHWHLVYGPAAQKRSDIFHGVLNVCGDHVPGRKVHHPQLHDAGDPLTHLRVPRVNVQPKRKIHGGIVAACDRAQNVTIGDVAACPPLFIHNW